MPCLKISNQFPFQRIEGWALIREVGAYSRGALIMPVSRVGANLRVGAYSREALNGNITVRTSGITIDGSHKDHIHKCVNFL